MSTQSINITFYSLLLYTAEVLIVKLSEQGIVIIVIISYVMLILVTINLCIYLASTGQLQFDMYVIMWLVVLFPVVIHQLVTCARYLCFQLVLKMCYNTYYYRIMFAQISQYLQLTISKRLFYYSALISVSLLGSLKYIDNFIKN